MPSRLSATCARARSPWARSATSIRRAANWTRRCASAGRRAAGLREARRRALARGHHGQDRRHLSGARPIGRGAAHPQGRTAARLREARRRALARGHHGPDRRHLEARGQLDEALRIRTEEQLPVYEKLGDVRSRAVTMGQIGDILRRAANWTRRCASARKKSCRSTSSSATCAERAVTMGKIGDIFQARGQLDEALRIRTRRRAAGLREARRRALARGHHGPDRRHLSGARPIGRGAAHASGTAAWSPRAWGI